MHDLRSLINAENFKISEPVGNMQDDTQQSQSLNDLNEAQTGSLACTWTLFGVTTIIVILRFVAQIKILRKAGVDDILIIISWVSAMRYQLFLWTLLIDLYPLVFTSC